MHKTTFPSTWQSLPITSLERTATSSSLSHKPTASSIQRRLVHTLTLHPFLKAPLTIIEIPAKGLVVRMVILRQMTTLKSMISNNCTLPNIMLTPTCPTPMVPMGTITSVHSLKVLSKKRNNQIGELANGFKLTWCCHPGRILSPPFILTVYAPLDDRLQFLSWLFEGALPRCMPSSSLTACEERGALATSHSSTLHEIKQNQRDRRKAQGDSIKNMPWSTEEADL